jgi:hypothetical protein
MGYPEEKYISAFHEEFAGRVAISVGYAQDFNEIYPVVFENAEGSAIGIFAIAALSTDALDAVHIFHLSAFKPNCGDGSVILTALCLKADQLNVALTLSPVPAPNGEPGQLPHVELDAWYRKFGFAGEGLLHREPQ